MVKEGRKVKAGNPKKYTDKAESKSEEKTSHSANSQSKYVISVDQNSNDSDYKNEGKYAGDSK